MTSPSSVLFRIYDVDDSGSINITEMTSIISTMDELEGEENMQGKDSPAARYKGVPRKMFSNCRLCSAIPGIRFLLTLSIHGNILGGNIIYLPVYQHRLTQEGEGGGVEWSERGGEEAC